MHHNEDRRCPRIETFGRVFSIVTIIPEATLAELSGIIQMVRNKETKHYTGPRFEFALVKKVQGLKVHPAMKGSQLSRGFGRKYLGTATPRSAATTWITAFDCILFSPVLTRKLDAHQSPLPPNQVHQVVPASSSSSSLVPIPSSQPIWKLCRDFPILPKRQHAGSQEASSYPFRSSRGLFSFSSLSPPSTF